MEYICCARCGVGTQADKQLAGSPFTCPQCGHAEAVTSTSGLPGAVVIGGIGFSIVVLVGFTLAGWMFYSRIAVTHVADSNEVEARSDNAKLVAATLHNQQKGAPAEPQSPQLDPTASEPAFAVEPATPPPNSKPVVANLPTTQDDPASVEPNGSSPDVANDLLERLKAATVFIKVATTTGAQSGSGFLLEVTENRGMIVTNAHVITPETGSLQEITCVFHSGTRNEFEAKAVVIGNDDATDLAVLTVETDGLPSAMDSASDVTLRETSPILVLGFPFGEVLTTSKRNPAISVSKGSISSIRKDDFENVVVLQIDGGINPGNSGGPMVSEDGKLVGICVAKVRGAEIGFAIPKRLLVETLAGRVGRVNIRESNRKADVVVYRCNLTLIDPRKNIRSAAIITFPANSQTRKAPEQNGQWQLASLEGTTTDLPIMGSSAVASVKVSTSLSDALFQIRWTRSDGSVGFTAPAPMQRPAGEPAPAIASHRIGPVPTHTEMLALPARFTEVDVAAGGRLLVFNLPELRQLAIVDVARRKVIKLLNVAAAGMCAAGADKVVFVSPGQRLIQRWDLTSFELELTKTLDLDLPPAVIGLGSASHGPILIAGGDLRKAALELVDLDTLSPLDARITGARVHIDGTSRLRVSADGRVFTSWQSNISPSGFNSLLVQGSEIAAHYKHDTVGHIAPNANGTRLYTAKGIYNSRIELIETSDQELGLPVPAVQCELYLRIEQTDQNRSDPGEHKPAVSLFVSGQPGALCTIPQVNLRSAQYRDRFSPDPIGLDQRIYFIPSENVLVTLPDLDNVVCFRDFDLDAELRRSGRDFLFVISSPPDRTPVDQRFDYQLVTKSNRGDVLYKIVSGPNQMTINQQGGITWKPTSDQLGRHVAVVAVSDAGGKEVLHTFRIDVVAATAPGPARDK